MHDPASNPPESFVSRGGLKLAHALREFALNVTNLTCADMGASTGGFTDCLLQSGAAKVYAIDTAYGELAWKLRKDSRVVVMERTNAVRASLPQQVDLVVVDLGWTTQRRLIPVARSWLAPAAKGIITLIKPHYECKELGVELPRGAILPEEQALDITQRVIAELTRDYQLTLKALTLSPLKGGATKSADTTKTKGTGNHEWLAWLTP